MKTIEYQGRTFPVTLTEDLLWEVRYLHQGRGVRGRVAARDESKLPRLLAVQSAAMGGTQLVPVTK